MDDRTATGAPKCSLSYCGDEATFRVRSRSRVTLPASRRWQILCSDCLVAFTLNYSPVEAQVLS